jgi:hypothetical protein
MSEEVQEHEQEHEQWYHNGEERQNKEEADGVERQTTPASGMPVSKTTANANKTPAKKTCCANMRSGCAATTLVSVSFCEKRKHRAMKSAPIKAAKILVN